MRKDCFVSTDIEADGPIPGPHSMLSFASVAYHPDGSELSTFTRNLHTLEGAIPHNDTAAFWRAYPQAYAATREACVAPAQAMLDYVAWLQALPGKPVFVAYPAGFDFMFIQWYLHRFVGRSPFGVAALDMKSFAMAVLGTPFHNTAKRTMPSDWFVDLPHTHIALDDAREQGATFWAMLRAAALQRAT